MTIEQIDATASRFMDYWRDADNWGGNPLVGGNVGGDASDKGYIVNMKVRGWITTEREDDRTVWIYFTDAGRAFAASQSI